MVDAAPFPAVRYDPDVAGDPASTSAPAYDDLDPLAYARHRTASPYTVLELLAGGAALRGGHATADGYAAAGAALARWRRTGVLVTEPAPAFYVYEEHELRRGVPTMQRGVLAAVAVEPLDGTGSVLPHEAVDPARVRDRLDRLTAVPIDVSPVFGLYRGAGPALRDLLDRPPRHPPLVTATDEDGTDHRIWALRDPAELAALRRGLAEVRVVIADGHHRYATALAFAERLRASAHPSGGGVPPWGRTLMYLVDAEVHGPRVLPVHRLAEGLPADVLERLDALAWRSPGPADPRALAREVAARRDGTIGLLLHGAGGQLLHLRDRSALARRLPAERSPGWRDLDAALLDGAVLPALGARRVVARSDLRATAAVVGEHAGTGLFLLAPVSTETVLDFAEAGEPMPAKTTSFRPKPRAGLLLRDVLPAQRGELGQLGGGRTSAP